MSTGLTLGDAIAALVAEKRAVGYKYVGEKRVLDRFAAFCRAEFPGLGTPSRTSVEAWITAAQRRGVKPATLQGLVAPVRELARWLGRRGVPSYLLPQGVLPRPARYVPHIYTDRELTALFAQADRCRYCAEAPLRHLVMPVLFRTIYGCGLRASEARLLRLDDVDLDAGVLGIRAGKGGKDRQVPAAPQLRARLGAYHAQVAGHPGTGGWFFPGRAGLPLTLGNVDKNFRRFLWQARIPHGGRGHGPRVHDLRHTFAVNNLRRWFAQGTDANALLPVLQAYMGHSSIADTAYYLRLTAESYPHITAVVQRALGDVVPPSIPGGSSWRLTSRCRCAASSSHTWPECAAVQPTRSRPTGTLSNC
jgi:integrase/recombinase XerD